MKFKNIKKEITLPIKFTAEDLDIYDLSGNKSITINNKKYIFNKDVDYISSSSFGILLRKEDKTIDSIFTHKVKTININ